MRPSSLALVVLSSFITVRGLTVQEFNDGIAKIDSDFANSGPSLDLLNQYDSLLSGSKELNADSVSLSKVYHKKAIIGLSLGKESQAIEDFLKSLELNPLNLSVKKTLFGLFVKHGDKGRFESIAKSYSVDDEDVLASRAQFQQIDRLVKKGDLQSLTDAINISPFDASLRSKRIEKTKELIKESKGKEQQNHFADLVDDYSKLIKSTNSFTSLTSNYKKLSEIYLFGLTEFSGSLNANKKCLHFDLDDVDCRKASKILNKYGKIFESLSTFSKVFDSWERLEEDDIHFQEIDIEKTSKLLVDSGSYLKIRRLNDNGNYRTNYDFIKSLTIQFNKEFNLQISNLELTILKTLTVDSFIKKDAKSFRTHSQYLLKLDPSQKEKFLPYILSNIDHALNQKNYHKVQELLQSCTKNQKKTSFYRERAEKFEHFQRQQHQHQHQQQQQQQQHQRQQYQQQYHQQQQRQKAEPKNDYYKILEVPRNADLPQIKKAYREKTKLFHPDKYKGDLSQEEIESKMTAINHAYEVLSNEETRRAYDQSGEDPNDPESVRSQGQPAGHNPFGQGFNFGQGGSFGGPFGGSGGSFQFNGGSFKFGGMKGKKRRRS